MPVKDQGINNDRYTIIPRTLIFLTCNENVLLIKGSSTKPLWANLFNGIGGHIEIGEDPLTAARRELKEETGLQADDLWLCAVILVDTDSKPGVGIFVFRGEAYTSHPIQLVASAEGNLTWVNKNDLASYPLVEDLFTILPRILTLEKNDPPLSILYSYDQDDHLIIKINN